MGAQRLVTCVLTCNEKSILCFLGENRNRGYSPVVFISTLVVPSMSEEKVDLRNIPTAADLFAFAPVIEEKCSKQNIAFMECKTQCEHPKECLSQAHSVQDCVMDT